MVHYGKEPEGELLIRVSPDDVGEVYGMLESAGLLQRRVFDGLKGYIAENYREELERHQRRMTAQIPIIGGKEGRP